MTNKKFNIVVDDTLQQIKEVLVKKAEEYNLTDDRLDVFKKAALRQRISTAQALLGYMDKHIGSIYDYIIEDRLPSKALAAEKIGDAINYLILLKAVWEEENEKSAEVINYE